MDWPIFEFLWVGSTEMTRTNRRAMVLQFVLLRNKTLFFFWFLFYRLAKMYIMTTTDSWPCLDWASKKQLGGCLRRFLTLNSRCTLDRMWVWKMSIQDIQVKAEIWRNGKSLWTLRKLVDVLYSLPGKLLPWNWEESWLENVAAHKFTCKTHVSNTAF